MKKTILISYVAFVAILGVCMPAVSFASQEPPPSETKEYKEAYVPCGTDDVNQDNIVDNPCGFGDVVRLGKRLITGWIIAGVIIGGLGFAYAGYLYITAMGSQEKISHAHSIFGKVFFGFVFMLSAWLIVKALESIFLVDAFKKESLLHTPSETAPAGSGDQKDKSAGGGDDKNKSAGGE